MKTLCLLITIVVAVSGAAQAALTISDTTTQSGFSGMVSNPVPVTGSAWDFSDQTFGDLTCISKIVVTITMGDGDTGWNYYYYYKYPEFDRHDLILYLDGVNTGLRLNGFEDGQINKRTNEVTVDVALSDTLLTTLADGQLVGTIHDKDWSDNAITLSACYDATLQIIGDTACATAPAPGALLLCGFGASVASWIRRRRSL